MNRTEPIGPEIRARPIGLRRLAEWWADRSLLTKALVAVGVPATALVFAAAAFFYLDAETRTTRSSVDRTLAVSALIDESRSLLLDAETGVRGYLLTGDPAFLGPHDGASGALSGVFARLESLVTDTAQAERLASLRPLVDQRLDLLSVVVALGPVGSGGPSAELEARLREGKVLMGRVREVIAEMDAAEQVLLAEREAQAEAVSSAGQRLVWGMLGFGLVGSVAAAILLTTGVVRRVRRLEANAALLAAGRPIVPLAIANDEVGRLAAHLQRASDLLVEREHELRQALDDATDLYENAPAGYYSRDADGLIVRMNATGLGWLGYERAEVVGKLRAIDLYSPESAERFRQLAAVFAERGSITDAELDMRRKDGSTFPILGTIVALRDEGGQTIGARVSVMDISARREAERELAKSRAELERFFDLSVDVFVVTGQHGRFERINDALARLLGYEREDILSRPWDEFVHPDDREPSAAEFAREVELGHRTIGFENRYVSADGSIHWMEWSAQLDPSSGVVYGVARDVTDRKRIEAALVSARREAEAANRAKTEFLSRISHELRTPLNAIIGFAQLLGMDDLDGEQRESQEQILSAGRHLLDLINEVLDISRIESGQLQISPEPVGVLDAVNDAVALIGPLATTRGIAVHVDKIAPDQHILADRQRVKQVLLNLLSNAVKYNRPNGTVRVACLAAGSEALRLSVTDEGPGLTPAQEARLFAPFDRLGAETGGTEGTGLGLALSKALVGHMDGRLGVDSTPGQGSTFWMELPVAIPEASERTTERPHLPTTAPAGSGTVLYIEDNISNFRLVERALAMRANVRLLPAMLGQLGMDLAREHRPDLILLDLHLPDMSGEDLLAQLRGDPATGAIPVVVLSADATPGQVGRLLADGARAYLTKPLDIGDFLALVDELLGPGQAG